MKLEIEIKKVNCKRLRKTVLVFYFPQLFVKFHLLRFYEQVQPEVNPRGQLSGVSG